jgi:hypothetical protein
MINFGIGNPPLSINQNQYLSLLGGLHDILEIFVLGIRLFQFGKHVRHGFKKAQKKSAFDGVIHVFGQCTGCGQRRRASNLAETMPTTLPCSSTSAPPEFPGCTGTLIWK